MSANVKHLVPLTREQKFEPPWSKELKSLLCRFVDLVPLIFNTRDEAPTLREVLTPDELAERLKLPKSTVEELARTGKLPAFRVGKHWRFDLDVLRKSLNIEIVRE